MVAESGWGADYPDPENYFFLFYSKNFPPEGKNTNRYHNPEFDRLFEQMAAMENSPERMEIIKKMNEILVEDTPIVPEFNKAGYVVCQPWAPRIQDNMMMDGGDVKYQPINPEMRARLQREWNRKPKWPIAAALALMAAALAYAIAINRKRNV
jgi:ABC-type oligopeptide transport system substrate-binding subunit